jgi:hypothetical protein
MLIGSTSEAPTGRNSENYHDWLKYVSTLPLESDMSIEYDCIINLDRGMGSFNFKEAPYFQKQNVQFV